MSALIGVIKELLWEQRPTTEAEATSILSGVTGRGKNGYNTQLQEWLESNPAVFPEKVSVEDIDHPQDDGLDVIVTGIATKERIGFQIKSDNDLKAKDFAQKLKAQITDASSRKASLIVIIFACTPSEVNKQKYKYIQNHFDGYHRDDILILPPSRAAGLYKIFKTPLKAPSLGTGAWETFFEKAGHQEYVSKYLDNWPSISPDGRFVEPQDFKSLEHFKPETPVKIIIGPPGVGKTFIAAQLLWREHNRGRGVRWISPYDLLPSDGPVPDETPKSDFNQRIDALTRTLGIEPKNPPIDSKEFIAKNLRPDTTVYIEDPFGKTDKEFEASLHTYNFFDLNEFCSSITASTSRAGCRLLITSREGLFDKWVDEATAKQQSIPQFEVIKIKGSSYSLDQRFRLAKKLCEARGLSNPDEFAKHIAADTEMPYEVEMLVTDLPATADIKDVISAVHAAKGNFKERARKKIAPGNDSERLFFLLVSTLSTQGEGRYNFNEAFSIIHTALGLEGDPQEVLQSCIGTFRSCISRMPVGGLMLSGEPNGIHLEPIHPSISEAIDEYLSDASPDWLNSVAISLLKVPQSKNHAFTLTSIATYLLNLGIGRQSGPEQEALCKIVFGSDGLSLLHYSKILQGYNRLAPTFKNKLFEYLKSKTQLTDFLSAMGQYNIPENEGFDAVRLLFDDPLLGGRRSLIFGNPWEYLFRHLPADRIPEDIKDRLDSLAKKEPARFSFGLGAGLVTHWEIIPPLWQEALLSPSSVDNPGVQKQILLSIGIKITNIAPALKELLSKQMNNANSKIRAMAGAVALTCHEKDAAFFEPIYTKLADDHDSSVPLEIIHEGLGDGDHDKRFLEKVLARADTALFANILAALLNKTPRDKTTWILESAELCFRKGDILSIAVATYFHEHSEGSREILNFVPSAPKEEKREPIILAWLWALANSDSKYSAAILYNPIELLGRLTGRFREFALYYCSVQYEFLPKELQEHLQSLESKGDNDSDCLIKGKKERQSASKNSRSLWGFPVQVLPAYK
ncbi:MAG: hypothetical protein PHV36_06150 [Elusimicrobiales bacterium]|nr:hypothetical protein [Elusimicrobiales bacterium]